MSIRTIRLELARNPGYPEGDAQCGYNVGVPLGADGRIDLAEFREHQKYCSVHRFWGGEDEQFRGTAARSARMGLLLWAGGADDESLYRPESHALYVGEYVTIREYDGPTYTFRVTHIA